MNIQKQKVSFQKKTGLTIIAFTTIIGFIICLNWQYLREQYYLSMAHQFKVGDNLYASQKIFEGAPTNTSVILLRLARPLTSTDIDRMSLNATRKDALKKSLDPQAQPFLIFGGKATDYITLNKIHTAFIGKYLGKKVLDFRYDPHKKPIPQGVFAIEPNDAAMTGDYLMKFVKMPSNYTWADNTYYVFYTSVTTRELPKFLK